jgi:uncharacterized protein DUF1937
MFELGLGGESTATLDKEGYWYLASVYSKWAPRLDETCDLVSRLAGKFITAGVPVFSPIAHSHTIAMAAGIDPLSHEIWMPADKPMVDNVVGMIVAKMEKWWTSKGIAQEIIWFTEHGKPHLVSQSRRSATQAR